MRRKHEGEGEGVDMKIEQPVFTKEQILKSQKFAHNTDVVCVVLTDDESYTMDQVDGLIQEFMKGEVK